MKRRYLCELLTAVMLCALLSLPAFADVQQSDEERAAINGALEWVEQQYNAGNYYESGYKVGEIMSWTLTDEQRNRAQTLQGKIAQGLQELDWEKIDQYIDDAEWQYKKGYTYEPLSQLEKASAWSLRDDQKSRISNLRAEINKALVRLQQQPTVNQTLFQLLGMTKMQIEAKYGAVSDWSGIEGGYIYRHGSCPFWFYYGGYDAPRSSDTCKIVQVKVSDLILNSQWSYTKQELESLFGTELVQFHQGIDLSAGYNFVYRGYGVNMVLYPTGYYADWNNGRIYADNEAELSIYTGGGHAFA